MLLNQIMMSPLLCNTGGAQLLFHVDTCVYLRSILVQLGISYFEIFNDIDSIYYGTKYKVGSDVGFFNSINYSLLCTLRRCGYAVVCLIGCDDCGGVKLKNKDKDGEVVVFEGDESDKFVETAKYKYSVFGDVVRLGIQNMDVEGLCDISLRAVDSGFGYYMRFLIKDYIDNVLKINISRIAFFGSESESIEYFGVECTHVGNPVYSDEQLFITDNALINDDVYQALKQFECVLDDIYITIKKFTQVEFGSEINCFQDHKNFPIFYPKVNDFDILNSICFSAYKYFWDCEFKYFKTITVVNNGPGILFEFLLFDKIDVKIIGDLSNIARKSITESLTHTLDVIIEVYDADNLEFTNLKGYRRVYVITNFEVNSNDFILVTSYYQFYLYLRNIYNRIDKPWFKNVCQRKYILHTEDFVNFITNKFIICNFALSNVNNQERYNLFLSRFKSNGFLVTLPSQECYRRGVIVDGDYKDFCVTNLNMFQYGDFMSILDFSVMLSPLEFCNRRQDVDFLVDFGDIRFFNWGVLLNKECHFTVQNCVNSPTLFLKSVTEGIIRSKMKMTKEQSYYNRFLYLKKIYNKLDLHIAYDVGYWSTSYYDDNGERRFLDVSGHSLGISYFCSINIFNLQGYIRMKNSANEELLRRDSFTSFGSPLFCQNNKNILRKVDLKGFYDELRTSYEYNNNIMWHTLGEDMRGIEFAIWWNNIENFGFNNEYMLSLKHIWRKNVKYVHGKVSMTVYHDQQFYQGLMMKERL